MKENPTYESLGDHTETIQLDYDPTNISYEELIQIFWQSHSPEYPPYSRQYMSNVFFHDEEQRKIAEKTKRMEEYRLGISIHTEIKPYDKFYFAEGYHQKYYLQQVKELVVNYREIYPNIKSFVYSTAVAKVNGYVKGYGTMSSLEKQISKLGLSQSAEKRLIEIVKAYGR